MTPMAGKNKKTRREPDKTAAEYYELKSGAVDELINANVTNTPEVSPKELNRYRRKSVRNMPEGLKYFLLKWWFAGVVCWFFMIGLGEYGFAAPDMIVIMGVVTGDALGCPEIDWEAVVAETVPAKVRDLNLAAFRAGREAAKAAK